MYNKLNTVSHRYVAQLCAGRHPIPGNPPAIFPGDISDPMDFDDLFRAANEAIPEETEELSLYITGLTQATLAVVSVCLCRGITIHVWHYDRITDQYKPQTVMEFQMCGLCGGRIPAFARVCPNCGG